MDEVLTYKCPNCGGALKFNATSGKMHCEYCDSDFDPDAMKQAEEIFKSETEEEPEWESYEEKQWDDAAMNVYLCQSCGAEVVADETTAATICPYCGSTTVLSGRLSGALKPDYIIPFAVTHEKATEELKKFCRHKWLLPGSFREENHVDSIQGMYVPFWLYDCDADANLTYDARRVRSFRQGDYMVTETSHFLIRRGGSIGFDKVPADGSKKMDDAYMDAIEPFDYTKLEDFSATYLSGYLADKFDVTAEECQPRATERVKNSTYAAFTSTVHGYSSVTPRRNSILLRDNKTHYGLLPVWMLNTKYRGKIYTFAMNGQTGRFVGKLPVSAGRFWGLFAGITAAVTAVISVIAIFLL